MASLFVDGRDAPNHRGQGATDPVANRVPNSRLRWACCLDVANGRLCPVWVATASTGGGIARGGARSRTCTHHLQAPEFRNRSPVDPLKPLGIRPMIAADADAVLAIYAEGIATGHATFEERVSDWEAFDRSRLRAPRRVAEVGSPEGGRDVVGWAVLSAVSSRPAYVGVAESTVYVATALRGRGVGRALLSALITASEEAGYWSLRAAIFPENVGSLVLHKALGFRRVGVFERVGRMPPIGPLAGRWRDVVLMERRSRIVGVDGMRDADAATGPQ
jgi:L-amino acid N-acyltransferase YncA